MTCVIMETADVIEQGIRNFLAVNQDGGKFDLPDVGVEFLVIPLMVAVFAEEGWDCEYEFNEAGQEWLMFKPGGAGEDRR